MGRVNTRRWADASTFTQDKRGFQPYKARDRPVSDLLPKVGQWHHKVANATARRLPWHFCKISVGRKLSGIKAVCRTSPAYRQKLRQAKSLPQLTRCYDFRKVLRTVCQSEGKERHRNSFSGIPKVLPRENGLIRDFRTF